MMNVPVTPATIYWMRVDLWNSASIFAAGLHLFKPSVSVAVIRQKNSAPVDTLLRHLVTFLLCTRPDFQNRLLKTPADHRQILLNRIAM